jgi:hypothetical protein
MYYVKTISMLKNLKYRISDKVDKGSSNERLQDVKEYSLP